MRGSLSTLLTVLVALLAPVGAVCAWASLEIGSSDRYVAAVAPLADDPGVRAAIADRVTDEVMKEVDTGPFQDQVAHFLDSAVLAFTDTAAFRTVWTSANRAAHDALDRALNDRAATAVTLDLTPVVAAVKQRLVTDGLPFADRIPVQEVQVTVLESDRLDTARTAYRWVRVLGVALPASALLLAVAAVALAVRRRVAVLRVGAALAVGAALLLAALPIGRAVTADRLAPDLDKAATEAVYDALTGLLRTVGWAMLAVGVLIAVVAWGRGRLRGRSSRAAGPPAGPSAGPPGGPPDGPPGGPPMAEPASRDGEDRPRVGP